MPNYQKQMAVGLLVAAVLFVLTTTATSSVLAYLDQGEVPPGVEVRGVPIGGESMAAAVEKLKTNLPDHLEKQINFIVSDRQVPVLMDRYGITCDYQATVEKAIRAGNETGIRNLTYHSWVRGGKLSLDPVFRWNADNYPEVLLVLRTKVDNPPLDASVTYRNDTFEYSTHQDGLIVDADATLQNLQKALRDGKLDGVRIVTRKVHPRIKFDDVKKIKYLLGVSETTFNADQVNRTINIKKASQAVNGSVLLPGQVFSLHEKIGSGLKEQGYLPAPTLANNRISTGIGGGICQVATTVYNAAIQAGLDIVEREPHSQPISYVPPGFDATLAGDSLDLKVKNNTGGPVMISVIPEGTVLTVRVFGVEDKKNQDIKIVSEKKTILPRVIIKIDQNLAPGTKVVKDKGRNGYRVKVYRVVSVDGHQIEKKLLSEDYYQPRNMLIYTGPSKPVGINK